MPTFFAFLLLAAASAQPPRPAGICAFNSRDGSGTATGVATLGLPIGNKGVVNVPAAIAATGPVEAPFVFVLIAPQTGPSDALFGWAITQNATAQTLFAWTSAPGATPTCTTASAALPAFFVPGFSLCGGGAAAALWPALQGSYSLGRAHVSQFSAPDNNCEQRERRGRRRPPPPPRLSTPLLPRSPTPLPRALAATAAAFTDDGALVTIRADNTPFGTGAFSIAFNGGGGAGFNAGWRIPAWCA